MKLSECINKYIKDNEAYIRERTIISYNYRKNYILKEFGDIDIKEITQEFLQDYINKQQSAGKTKNAINNSLNIIIMALKQYKTFNRFRYVNTEKDMKEKKCYSDEDLEIIENFVVRSKQKRFIPIMLAINTGMRLSEIAGLKWGDIDFDNRTINVKRQICFIDGKFIESLPKSKSGLREIPINTNLYNYLMKIKADKDWFVVSSKSDITRSTRSIQRTNELLCKKLGIEYCGMHAYRHCFATKLLKSSNDFKGIANIMGHSDIAITQNIYNHPTTEQKKNIIESCFDKEENTNGECSQQQIIYLQQQINELKVAVTRLTQYIQDTQKNTLFIDNGTRNAKYKVVDSFRRVKYFKTRKELQQELDIDYKTLKEYFAGEFTIINELGISIVEL